MAITPLIALLVVYRQYNDPPLPPVVHQQNRLRLNMLPYLLCALLLAATVSLMQLGLAPHLSQLFSHSATTVSHHVAILLSIAAGCTLLAQFLVVRPQRFTPPQLLLVAALLMVLGLGLMCVQPLVLFYLGCALASFGAAMATPGYQLMLNDRLSTGKGSGVIATSHTLGYGMSALMVPVVAKFYGESQLVAAAFMMAILLGGSVAGCGASIEQPPILWESNWRCPASIGDKRLTWVGPLAVMVAPPDDEQVLATHLMGCAAMGANAS